MSEQLRINYYRYILCRLNITEIYINQRVLFYIVYKYVYYILYIYYLNGTQRIIISSIAPETDITKQLLFNALFYKRLSSSIDSVINEYTNRTGVVSFPSYSILSCLHKHLRYTPIYFISEPISGRFL